MIDNEYVVKAYVEWSNDDGTTIEELEPNDIILFKNNNIVSTNYQNVDIELIYPTYDDFNKYYTNTLTYNSDKKANKSLTMNDLYFKDSFTKTGNEINEEIDNLNVKCITSKNNKFSLDSDGNLNVNSITSNENKNLNITEICNVIYPIGSVYISINNIEPSSLFGGTWEKLEDRFLLASGKTYTNGNIGGEATHKLTIDEMPSHTHTLYIDAKGTTIPAWWTRHLFVQNDSPHEAQPNNLTSTGNSQPHNNMPPYLVVNMWKRTA